jgi:hypothetical protein
MGHWKGGSVWVLQDLVEEQVQDQAEAQLAWVQKVQAVQKNLRRVQVV